MKWRNVKLILGRELRDQLRDRRTLFTVLVLPLLMYPLMGIAMLQVSQFSRPQQTRIWLIGADHLPASPQLVVDGAINHELLEQTNSPAMEVLVDDDSGQLLSHMQEFNGQLRSIKSRKIFDQQVSQELISRKADLAVIVSGPIDVTRSLSDRREQLRLPRIYVFSNSAQEKSSLALVRITSVLNRYRQQLAMQVLASNQVNAAFLDSFVIENSDIGDARWKQAATWSKILPFIVMIWSLTGAFYPAVDLCAGEKERGTFETLLSSPALRSEIAIGKLLTVMAFSIATSLLNLVSMGFTGIYVISRLGAQMASQSDNFEPLGLPPVSSLFWLMLALIPISALFSAVALAAASFAKSSKEGQYYLVPLMMISMPLMMIPMLPAAKLDLGTSLIPVSGLMLMLRGLIEGRQAEVLQFSGPVVAVTLVCCWLAIRWVVNQFNRESVIFRPSERFSVNVWLRHVMRERNDLPLMGHALLCGVVILVIKFFVSLGATPPVNWLEFTKQTMIILVAAVAMPSILMAMFLTRRPLRSLKLASCRIPVACAAVLAAILLHPAVTWLSQWVLTIYPPSGDLSVLENVMKAIMADAPGFWAILLVMAVAPAVIEELAFRGFILSGLQSMGSSVKAILISSLLFGAAHSILQQSIITFFLGCILGLIAVKTRSLIPCVLYHVVHNGISIAISKIDQSIVSDYPSLNFLFQLEPNGGIEYVWAPALIMTVAGGLLIAWLWNYGDAADKIQTSKTVLPPFLQRLDPNMPVPRS